MKTTRNALARIGFFIGVVATGFSPSAWAASPADIPVEVFAQLPQVSSPKISPDGEYIALMRPYKGQKHFMVQKSRPAPGDLPYVLPPQGKFEIDWFDWANNERLVVGMKFEGTRLAVPLVETRLFAVNRDGSEFINVVKPKLQKVVGKAIPRLVNAAQIQDDVIDLLWNDPKHILLSIDADWDGEDEVRRVDIYTGNYKEISADFRGIQNFMTDQSGELRLAWGFDRSTFVERYKSPDTNEWINFKNSRAYQNGYRPIMFAEDPRLMFMRRETETGTSGIYKYNLVTDTVVENVFSDDTYSAGRLLFDERKRKPLGVAYTDDKPRFFLFDEKAEKRRRAIDRALKTTSNRVVSSTDNDEKHIVRASSDLEPGVYYVYDEPNKRIFSFAVVYENLDPEMMSPMKAVSYKARDGLEIPSYLTVPKGKEAKNLPVVVMPHGGPHARDSISFDYWTQFLASRGYAVFQPNFRGSSGYTDAFEEAGKLNWGLKMQDDITDGVKWLIEQGIADPGRICIVGASYGGYAALMGTVKTPDLFKCAVSVSGVSNLPTFLRDIKKYIGGRSWARSIGKDGKSTEEIKEASPYLRVDEIKTPILLIHAKDDRTVPSKQSKMMASRLKKKKKTYTYIELKNGGHSLDTRESRLTTLKAIEKFLAEHLGTTS